MSEFSAQPNIRRSNLSPIVASATISDMPKRGPHKPKGTKPTPEYRRHFIKEWRLFRDMTVDELAEAAGMSNGNLSALENRKQGHSDAGLANLARALGTTAGALLNVNPLDPNTGDFWRLWERATKKDRDTLTIMAERLVGTDEKPASLKK